MAPSSNGQKYAAVIDGFAKGSVAVTFVGIIYLIFLVWKFKIFYEKIF